MKIENNIQSPHVPMSTPQTMHNENIDKGRKDSILDKNIDLLEYTQIHPEYQPTIAEKTVIEAIEKANKKLNGVMAEFEFSIHEETKQIMVKVINKETKELIREIPPEKILDMVAHLWEVAGIIVDEKR
ncbi:MAG: flagellar protein FlaG [Epulopiscium sp.]|jgi:flagellar protein FlaG|uniref:flagellar protein FlaG n=1 Tax=Defluviitalea raffinosedens TaxID=1450156 RepID=UPI001957B874|nr:flagellar protein FlaG [Defluviitalea raffinosedens]MBM7684491.1 flagellar protein FlaG [Defluviitalea raffinosedens]MDK2787432.1 flagellar protein FlaG [Candidatus Epulonipiscium sp.]